MHNDSELCRGRVVKRARGNNRNPIGCRNPRARFNLEMGKFEYMVEFDDGAVDLFTENIIDRNIFSQVYTDGHDKTFIKEVIDYRVISKAVTKANGFIVTRSGTRRPKFTCTGWEFLLESKDGSTDWIPLKDLKNSNLIEISE